MDKYEELLRGFWAGPTASRIQQRGYWEFRVYPSDYVEERVDNVLRLHAIVKECAVACAGRQLPYVGPREDAPGSNYYGQEHEMELFGIYEVWRMHLNGCFLFARAYQWDWDMKGRDKEQRMLYVPRTVVDILEALQYAHKLCFSEVGATRVKVVVRHMGLLNRKLYLGRDYLGLCGTPLPREQEFVWECEVAREALGEESRALAVKCAQRLFHLWGWEASVELLGAMIDRLQRR